jgi:hypothetical protein
LLPREIRGDQFSEWRDEIQCAQESGLPAGRRTLSIAFRSAPRLAWRARRSSRQKAVEGLDDEESQWKSRMARERLFFLLLAGPMPVVFVALGFFDAYAASPTSLFYLIKWVGGIVMIALAMASLSSASKGYSSTFEPYDEEPTAAYVAKGVRTVSSLVLVVLLVTKMVVFSQYSPLFYFATCTAAIFFVASFIDRRRSGDDEAGITR